MANNIAEKPLSLEEFNSFFQQTWERLAVNGAIGDPCGEPAYGYIRVSTHGQKEDEGATGLPRQLINIHEKAKQEGLRIPWDMVFADDYTGFEFNGRPQLTRLLKEIKEERRRADKVVIELMERLSRNVDWHQGYLLEQFTKVGVDVILYKGFSSRIERVVMGAISQDGMEETKRKLVQGMLIKAMNGNVTARGGRCAYGFQLVDSDGNPGEKARKDTHYGILEPYAGVMRNIYDTLAFNRMSLAKLCEWLNEHYDPPKGGKAWNPRSVNLMVRNPVYKGQFIANRWKFGTTQMTRPNSSSKVRREGVNLELAARTRQTPTKEERPKEEWIIVPVPAIVSEEIWEMANRTLDRNKGTAYRNGKGKYMLTGLIRCATCGTTFVGTATWAWKGHPRTPEEKAVAERYDIFRYRCGISRRTKKEKENANCHQKMVRVEKIEDALWEQVVSVLLHPETLLDQLDADYESEHNQIVLEEIAYIDRQFEEIKAEDVKLKKAYLAEVFNEIEYKEERDELKKRVTKLQKTRTHLEKSILSAEQVQAKKNMILNVSRRAQESGISMDTPWEIKRSVIRTIVDRIILDANAGIFTIEGVMRGTYTLDGMTCADIELLLPVRKENMTVEMSAAQASRSVEEVWAHAKMSEEDKHLTEADWRENIVASCPECHTPLQTNAKFCPECGAKLQMEKHCTECGEKVQPGQKFCANCGAKVQG